MRPAVGVAITLAFSSAACGSRSAGGITGAAGNTGVAGSGGGGSATGGTVVADGAAGAIADAGVADAGVADTSAPGSGLLGPWKASADYPLASATCAGTAPNLVCAPQTCVASSGSVYCVGGNTNSTYFSAVSSMGLGPWTATTNYPIAAWGQSCVIDSNVMYCVGGRVGGWAAGASSMNTASAYFAPVSSTGVGDWAPTTDFPTTDVFGCVASGGYIYCLSDTPYYAPLTASGIGTWAPTQGPPTRTEGCTEAGGYIYCFGGGDCPPRGPGGDCYSPSYYAPLTATGIGTWKTTTPLPTAVSATLVGAGDLVYYLSIPVFAARVSSSGIGPWETATNYPRSGYASSCVSSAGYIYCASPEASWSYLAQVGVANPSSLRLVNPPSVPRSQYLVRAWNNEGGGFVTVDGVMAGAPQFVNNIDEAVIFDCAAAAATPSGCQTTVTSPANTSYNYDMTIWYPCAGASTATTNCCFLPKLGYPTPFNAWCASTDTGSFIITQAMTLR
jgi:hypothetical protein